MPDLRQVSCRMTVRTDTSANWAAENPTLLNAEIGWESDSVKLKVGDGVTPWTGLGYYSSGEDAPGSLVHDDKRFPSSVNSYKGALEYLFDRLAEAVGEHAPEDLEYLSTDILTEAGDYLTTEGGDLLQFNY